jgi:putative phage-type endonuclease
MEQGSQEWLAARLGRVTASRVADVLARTKSGPSASRANYAAELVLERALGKGSDFFVNDAMRRGTELEPIARDCYSFETGNSVVEVGFIAHPTIAWSGASPDGLVGDDGLVEIKCCNAAKHLGLLKGGEPDDRYVKQAMWQMACTGRKWVDLTFYHPDFPVEHQLHIIRIDRDDAELAKMEAEVTAFLREVEADTTFLIPQQKAA